MPVIINTEEDHPFLPKPGDLSAIDLYRAEHQDIRPLDILVINLMADKIGTERYLARCLGDTEIQVKLTFAATDDYIDEIRQGRVSMHTPAAHIEKFYNRFGDVRGRKYDGLVVTGVNAREHDITQEPMWPQVKDILDWSTQNVVSSLFLCWAGHAALKHFYNIDRRRSAYKTSGVFDHCVGTDATGLFTGFSDQFPIPVSRWNEISAEDVKKCVRLELTSVSDEAGVGTIVEPQPYDDGQKSYPRRLFILNHPEYDTDVLHQEYVRDFGLDAQTRLPKHYFPDNDITRAPTNRWRWTGRLYANWVRSLYYATPYDIALAPEPYRRAG